MTRSGDSDYDVIIVGAGAAGLMCALTAGGRGRRVLLLDHADEAGKKILISGGGRCNFTNLHCAPENFISGNPHFCKSALARYTQYDFIELVDRHRIAWHEKTLGQLFCDGSARAVVDMLLAECDAAGVDLRLSRKVTDISRSDRFRVDTAQGTFTASSLVLASGGLSIPKMGATGFAHDTARKFGLSLSDIHPGSGAADLRRGGFEIHAAAQRRRTRQYRLLRASVIPRGAVVHPSRLVRPGHLADFFLLARRAGNRA